MRPLIWPQIAHLALISAVLTSAAALAQAPLAEPAPAAEELVAEEQRTVPPIPVAIDPPPAPQRRGSCLMWFGLSNRVPRNTDGRLSCVIVSEDPEEWGFGEATLRIARHFRIAPTTRVDTPTAGGRIRRTIRWIMQ